MHTGLWGYSMRAYLGCYLGVAMGFGWRVCLHDSEGRTPARSSQPDAQRLRPPVELRQPKCGRRNLDVVTQLGFKLMPLHENDMFLDRSSRVPQNGIRGLGLWLMQFDKRGETWLSGQWSNELRVWGLGCFSARYRRAVPCLLPAEALGSTPPSSFLLRRLSGNESEITNRPRQVFQSQEDTVTSSRTYSFS